MRIGIGLPNPVPGTPGDRLVQWAVRAEERGFAGLATIDRLVYPSHDSLISLAGAAGATNRIGLMTNILLGPLYPAVPLAKATATLDQLSGGRFTLGLAPGGRPDDYRAAGRDFHTRGADLDAQLDLMHRAWSGENIAGVGHPATPPPTRDGAVPVMIGGTSDAAVRRAARWGAGWTAGGAPAKLAAPVAERVRGAWREVGRDGEPRVAGLVYFSLGDDVEQESRAYLRNYYGFAGERAELIASGALRTDSAIKEAVSAFTDLGFTELYFDPTVASLDQVDRLADLIL